MKKFYLINYYLLKNSLNFKVLFSIGGLGNQLFIFNFAHKLNEDANCRVYIFSNWHDHAVDRPFELDKIVLHCKHNIRIVSNKRLYSILTLIIKTSYKLRIDKLVRFVYDEILANDKFSYRRSILIWGYFQNKIYFPERFDLAIEIAQTLAHSVNDSEFATFNLDSFQSVHIRRGDYASHRNTFGQLDYSFYASQLKMELPCVVATDETHSEFEALVPKDINVRWMPITSNAWELLYILGLSKYFIGSNSTLSYWTAVIVTSKKGQATLPDPWFKNHPKYMPKLHSEGIEFITSKWDVE
jgi:hypothetical protein